MVRAKKICFSYTISEDMSGDRRNNILSRLSKKQCETTGATLGIRISHADSWSLKSLARDRPSGSQGLASSNATRDEPTDDELDESDDRKYCICKRVSYGDMVACDNESCKLEWFHWSCVGLKSEPVGTWICPICIKAGKQKSMQQNQHPQAERRVPGRKPNGRQQISAQDNVLVPKTISPKDVDLVYHESEKDANTPLFPLQQHTQHPQTQQSSSGRWPTEIVGRDPVVH